MGKIPVKEIFSSCLCQEINLREEVKGIDLFISMEMCNPIGSSSGLLRDNLTDSRTLQSYKLNYFIKQRVIFSKSSDS